MDLSAIIFFTPVNSYLIYVANYSNDFCYKSLPTWQLHVIIIFVEVVLLIFSFLLTSTTTNDLQSLSPSMKNLSKNLKCVDGHKKLFGAWRQSEKKFVSHCDGFLRN